MHRHLFSSITLAGLQLPNRIMVSPMCMYSAVNGQPTSWHRLHLGTLSLSGAAILMVEATAVEARGRISPGCLGLFSDQQEEAFAALIAELREHSDIKIGIQLAHSGRKGSRLVMMPRGSRALGEDEGGWQVVGPSPVPYNDGWAMPHELDDAGLAEVRNAFADAAKRAERAGFDAVEIHAAHGYLLHSFRTANANQRTDRYGGSPERRCRFPLEVVGAVREALASEKPLGVRVNGEDWHDDGVTLEETVEYARALKSLGVDYVTTSGGASSPHIKPPPVEPGYMVGSAEAVRRGAGVATTAVGMIVDPVQAEAIIAEGRADLVAIGRGMLDDPRWGWHAAAALGETVGYPGQYEKARPGVWKGYQLAHH